jgi:hypothetical protein
MAAFNEVAIFVINSFFLLVPGGGANPHNRKGWRILNPIYCSENCPARPCTESHKSLYKNKMDSFSILHPVAPECTKSRYKVAPKRHRAFCVSALESRPSAADFRSAASTLATPYPQNSPHETPRALGFRYPVCKSLQGFTPPEPTL